MRNPGGCNMLAYCYRYSFYVYNVIMNKKTPFGEDILQEVFKNELSTKRKYQMYC